WASCSNNRPDRLSHFDSSSFLSHAAQLFLCADSRHLQEVCDDHATPAPDGLRQPCGGREANATQVASRATLESQPNDHEKKRPVRSLPPSKPLTGPAPPRRSVCAPEGSPSPFYGRPPSKGDRELCGFPQS